jgi:FkbM family methyltransferase
MLVTFQHPTGLSVSTHVRNDIEKNIVRGIVQLDEYLLHSIFNDNHPIHYVVDVGCHVGAFTQIIKRLWAESHVLAIDPAPGNVDIFKQNTQKLLPGIHWYQKAAVNSDERVVHLANTTKSPNTFTIELLNRLNPYRIVDIDEMSDCEVEAARVSELLVECNFPYIDILKVDAEGAEPEVLEDLASTGWLRRTGWIRFEWHDRASIDRIETVLQATHSISMDVRSKIQWGSGYAHSNSLNYKEATT